MWECTIWISITHLAVNLLQKGCLGLLLLCFFFVRHEITLSGDFIISCHSGSLGRINEQVVTQQRGNNAQQWPVRSNLTPFEDEKLRLFVACLSGLGRRTGGGRGEDGGSYWRITGLCLCCRGKRRFLVSCPVCRPPPVWVSRRTSFFPALIKLDAPMNEDVHLNVDTHIGRPLP